MEKDTLYKFFDGKASQEEKKAVRAFCFLAFGGIQLYH